ncbi:MAG: FtsW/RodA/SpoVE family cell cycle protein [Clostridia bacterium]|nr:FtsW/RodA/SpoVE family cell cycle protein [Clostridia bacterium]
MKEKEKKKRSRRINPATAMLSAIMTFFFLGFLMLAVKDGSWQSFLLAIVVPVLIFVGTAGIPKLFPADKLLLSLTNFLCALGVLTLYRLSPSRGLSQAVNYGVGVGAMLLCILLVRCIRHWKALTVLMMGGSLLLLALPLIIGAEKNGAKSWINLGPVSMQPSEMVKLALMLSVSYLLSRRKIVLSILFTGACLLLLMVQKDLGTALLYYGVALILIFVATGSKMLLGAGLLGGAGAAVIGYQMFAHVKKRVAIWIDPWQDASGAGYQIVQSLIAIVNGGLWGVGLGLGNASVIPEYYNDFIFSVILHEFGIVFGLIVLCMYVFIIIRGVMIARRSRTVFHALLATACASLIALQTFVIIGGNIKLIPLTGVTLPFISYGGTSMVSSLCVIGLLQGVASVNEAGVKEDRSLAMQGGNMP